MNSPGYSSPPTASVRPLAVHLNLLRQARAPLHPGTPRTHSPSGIVQIIGALGVVLVALLGSPMARAQPFPSKPIRFVIGFPPGTIIDIALNFGLWAPPSTPREIIQRLSTEAAAVLKRPAIIDEIRQVSAADAVGSTPEEQLRIFDAEVKYWTEAAHLANFRPQ